MTQEALAEKANLEKSFLQKIERGIVNLSIESLVALASALEVRPEALFREAQMQERKVGRPVRKAAAMKIRRGSRLPPA